MRFLTIILFYWLKWVLKKPLLLEKYYDINWLQFCGQESFFCWEIWQKNGENCNYFSEFFAFFHFLFLAKSLCLLWLAYCFPSIWIPYWLKGIFLWIYMFSEILKSLVTFSSFSVKLFLRAFFIISPKVFFFKIHVSGFCKY